MNVPVSMMFVIACMIFASIKELYPSERMSDVFYLAIPKIPDRVEGKVERFAAVCAEWPATKTLNAGEKKPPVLTAWRTSPKIPPFIHTPNKGVAREKVKKMFSDKYVELPAEMVEGILNSLFSERSEDELMCFQPLFPIVQETYWNQSERISAFLMLSENEANVREKNLVLQLETNLNRENGKNTDFAHRFSEFCHEMGVPVKSVWYISELNVLVILSDKEFGGLMAALFSVAS